MLADKVIRNVVHTTASLRAQEDRFVYYPENYLNPKKLTTRFKLSVGTHDTLAIMTLDNAKNITTQ